MAVKSPRTSESGNRHCCCRQLAVCLPVCRQPWEGQPVTAGSDPKIEYSLRSTGDKVIKLYGLLAHVKGHKQRLKIMVSRGGRGEPFALVKADRDRSRGGKGHGRH